MFESINELKWILKIYEMRVSFDESHDSMVKRAIGAIKSSAEYFFGRFEHLISFLWTCNWPNGRNI